MSSPAERETTERSEGNSADDSSPISRSQLAAGGAIGIILLIGTFTFYRIRVCEDQVGATGIVEVCRRLETSDPPAVGAGILLVALLGVFFKQISILGVSVERIENVESRQDNLARIQKQIQEQQGQLNVAAATLDETVADLGDANERILAMELVSTALSKQMETTFSSPASDLAAKYNQLRWTMPSSNERTLDMEAVVSEMKDRLRDRSDVDVLGHLHQEDRGLRLAGYARLYVRPEPALLSELVEVVAREDKPFGTYHGLRAVHRLVEETGSLERKDRMVLEALRFPEHSDRGMELRRILQLG